MSCVDYAFGAVGIYFLLLLFVASRLLKHGKDGRAPRGFSAHRKSSYDPEGQRLLSRLRGMVFIGVPAAFLVTSLARRLLC
jgi:hypothetical protein